MPLFQFIGVSKTFECNCDGAIKVLKEIQEKPKFKLLNLLASESMNDVASINQNAPTRPFGRKPSCKAIFKPADCGKTINSIVKNLFSEALLYLLSC